MRVQTKLTALLVGVTLLFAAGLGVNFYVERQRAVSLLASERQLDEDFFDRLMQLQGASLTTFSQDYTYWDEMVRFVETRDPRWAHDILDTALPTYRATALWVTRTDFTPVYAAATSHTADLRELPLPRGEVRAAFTRAMFPHFFVLTPAGLMEMRGAPIHPTHDTERRTAPRGYFLTGRLWDEAMVRELSELTGLGIRVVSNRGSEDGSAAAIQFERELTGWDGEPVRTIRISKESAIAGGIERTARSQGLLLVSFALVVLAALSVFLSRWVVRPLRLIERSLQDQRPSVAPSLQADASEFGRMAELVARFVRQKADLDAEMVERQKVEQALRESEERYALAARGANEGLWDWNLATDEVYFSARWKSMLGYEVGEVGSTPSAWFDLVHPDDLERLRSGLVAHCAGQTPFFENEHRMRHKDGTDRWVLSRGAALTDAGGHAYRMAGSQTDVTDRTMHDLLTGLPNRALFVDRLKSAMIRRGRRPDYLFAVILLDLDRFKLVNDSFGHAAGDHLLIEAAHRLEACLRPGDTIARLGGDEFALLLDELRDAHDAVRVAERVQRALAAPIDVRGREVFATASLGIALCTTGYPLAEDLLRDADTALHRAKALGKARHEIFDANMRERAVARLSLETDLRRALERGELSLLYQPIVTLPDARIAGFEALIRWTHPDRGPVGPMEFIPVAEDTGLIVPIGLWVLRESCRQMREWERRGRVGHGQRMSVNLSAKQFAQPDLDEQIERVLDDTGLVPEYLKVEITESLLMTDPSAAVTKLQRLQTQRIQVALDDFGTGYSSLGYLRRFPVDTIKIDRSFVMLLGCEGGEIVETIITLAHSLKKNLVAEGVETREQAERLAALGCEYAQGYLFSRPVPADRAGLLLESPRLSQAA